MEIRKNKKEKEDKRLRKNDTNFGFRAFFDLREKTFGGQMVVTKVVSWRPNKNPDLFYQVRALILVAGAGFEPTTSGL